MTEPSIFFNEVNERQGVFHRRAFLMGGLITAGLVTLGGRLAELQIVENGRYTTLAANNQYNFRLVPPPRGRILDRNGVELASNRPNFRLLLLKDQVADVDAALDTVAQLIPITPERRRQLRREIENSQRFVPVALAEDLSWDEFARLNVRTPELAGLQADMSEARVYPFGGAFSHVIGYVSKVSDAAIKAAGPNPDPLLLNPGFRIGKQGVEKSLDLDLRGKAGGQKVEVDARGRMIREDPLGDIKPTPGKEVVLTLDADVQNRAMEAFGADSGAAVMMDCRSGDILCMYSGPSFDANRFVKGLSGQEYGALVGYDRKPLLNKALTATYPPGSTFKTMVAVAALEKGIDPSRTYTCSGSWHFGNRVWHCDKAHGTLNMHDAIKTSCDIYFYQTALALGPDAIAMTARKFGLGEIFDIGIPGQKAGLVPDTAYKRRNFPRDPAWHPGETPSFGIGQGYLNLNPLQLCVMVARLANGAKALQPRLIHSIGGVLQPAGSAAPDLPVAREHIDFVRAAMASVANDVGGTAYAASQLGLGPVMMAGKTGTAQARNFKAGGSRKTEGLAWEYKEHAWFIAFAPVDDPRYALSVLVEHGGFGAQAAAPKAREIMRVALLKDPEIRARIEKPMPMPELPPTPEGVRPEGVAPPEPTDDPPSGQPAGLPAAAAAAPSGRGR
ncbi:MAG: penicillin-binding protein 2 [Caulobacteraceae bacterium]|nr:penicillin-binding protein 2 [Caulobacteraceae bacterium]